MTNDSQTYSYSECGEMYSGKYASPEEAAAAYFRNDFYYVKELRKITRSELTATGHLQPPEAGGRK